MDYALIEFIRNIPYRRWSKTFGAWHLPNTNASKVTLERLASMGVSIRWPEGE